MDMSPAYIGAVPKNLPQADIVFDHFHLFKLLNEKLSDLRRDLFRELKDTMHKQVIKGTRWLLLKNPENLEESKNEKARLEEALKLNQALATAYHMKEDFRQIWMPENKKGSGSISQGLDGSGSSFWYSNAQKICEYFSHRPDRHFSLL